MHAKRRTFGIALAVLSMTVPLLLIQGIATAKSERHYALVVGHNSSTDANLAPLRYADDDAIRYFELFDLIADEAILMTTPDKETTRLYPNAKSVPPTRDAVFSALADFRQSMQKDLAQGIKPVLYFVYSGHGSYDDDGSGFLYLADGEFTTRDLYDQVISPNKDANVVLMVDACNAALLVHSRGPSAPVVDREEAPPSLRRLEDFPHVGVILSSSTVGEVHEWGRYLSGVFSHEVRSAMLGPGDLDGDRKVTFAELAAFVSAANEHVSNPTIRLTPYIRPPLNRPDLPVIDLEATPFPARVKIGADSKGQGHLLDAQLIRYMDFHIASGKDFEIGLVDASRGWVVVQGKQEWLIDEGKTGTVPLTEITPRQRTVIGKRSATSEYFDRTLFQQRYTTDYARNFLENDYMASLTVERMVVAPWYENTLAWTLVGSGVAIAASGIPFTVDANHFHNKASIAYSNPGALTTTELSHFNTSMQDAQSTAGILYGIGGAAVISGILTFVLDRDIIIDRYQPPIEILFGENGIRLQGRFE